MAGEPMDPFEQGSWVKVWARVREQRRVHPEDLVVNTQSHNSDVEIHVRRDWVTLTERQPSWARTCPSLFNGTMSSPNAYLRCTRPAYHDTALVHRNGTVTWTEAQSSENVEL